MERKGQQSSGVKMEAFACKTSQAFLSSDFLAISWKMGTFQAFHKDLEKLLNQTTVFNYAACVGAGDDAPEIRFQPAADSQLQSCHQIRVCGGV